MLLSMGDTAPHSPKGASAGCSALAKRQRSYALPLAVPADTNIVPLLDTAKRHSGSPAVVNGALASLAELTSWQSQNQQGVVDTNGLCTLLALLKCGAESNSSGAQSDEANDGVETVRLVLWVLMNLAANDDISPRIAEEPDCLRHLVTLLAWGDGGSSRKQCGVFAGRCLVNLTRSSSAAQKLAIKAGALKVVSKLLPSEQDDGALKVYIWLLATLTASHESPARAWIAAAPELLHHLLSLLDCSQAASAPAAILAARTLGNIARGGSQCQASLDQAGAITQLLTCLSSTAATNHQLAAAVMEALSALAMDRPAACATILAHHSTVAHLEAIICRSTAQEIPHGPQSKEVTSASPQEGHALLAASVLVHVLAYGKQQAGGPQALQGFAAQHTQLRMRLADAARMVGIHLAPSATVKGQQQQQQPLPGSSGGCAAGHNGMSLPDGTLNGPGNPGDICASKQGSQAVLQALPAVQLAELLYTVHDVLLPRMRERNVSVACDAVAQLYLLAATGSDEARAAAMQLLAEAGLVQQVVSLLQLQDAQLATACLCLLDAMSQDAGCCALLAEADWLDEVERLLDSPDGVVRLLARRALCSVYAQEAAQEGRVRGV